MLPKWKPPLQSAGSVTVATSSPDNGSLPCTTTPEPRRSGCDVVLQDAHRAVGDGGGENVTTIWSPISARPAATPPLTMTNDGTSGVTGGEGADGGPEPTALEAATVKVYVVPLVSPLRRCDVAVEVKVWRALTTVPTYVVTVYEVMGLPPSSGADHDSRTTAFPGVAVTPVGGDGAVGGGAVVVVLGPPPTEPPGPPTVDVVEAGPASVDVEAPTKTGL